MSNFSYKDLEIELIYNKKLKNTYISIDAKKKIIVKTSNISQHYLVQLLDERESWIRKQLKKITLFRTYAYNLEDEVLLYGEKYSIDRYEASILREKLNKLQNYSKENILKCYDAFYKSRCLTYLSKRVEYFASIMNVEYEILKFRKMKSRWGSCNSQKVITLNSELIKLEKELIDYVVVHELAHLTHMNHSKKFHNLVEKYLENSQDLRKRLKNVRIQVH